MPAPSKTVIEPTPEFISPGTEQTFFFQGTRTRYWEYGSAHGQPVVLIHGFRGDHHGLEIIANQLHQLRVIIPDLPAFGKSEEFTHASHNLQAYGAWLNTFLIHVLQGQTCTLVGHSFGSIVASYYAANYSDCINKLVLINPISQPALQGGQRLMSLLAETYYQLGSKLPTRLGLRLLKSPLISLISSRFMAKNHDKTLQTFIDGQHLAYFGSFSTPTALLEAYRTSISQTASNYAAKISHPTLLIVAEKDDLGTLKTQQDLLHKLPDGTMEIIPEVGHLIHYETPRLAAHLIASFIHQETHHAPTH